VEKKERRKPAGVKLFHVKQSGRNVSRETSFFWQDVLPQKSSQHAHRGRFRLCRFPERRFAAGKPAVCEKRKKK
jgi:hypothetical protein